MLNKKASNRKIEIRLEVLVRQGKREQYYSEDFKKQIGEEYKTGNSISVRHLLPWAGYDGEAVAS